MADMVLDFKVATANLMQKPRHDDTIEADLKEIQSTGADLVFCQEASNGVYKSRLARLDRLKLVLVSPARDFGEAFLYDPDKIMPTQWASAPDVSTPKNEGGTFPRRYFASQTFDPVRDTSQARFAARNLHQVARAWAGDGSPQPRSDPEEAADQPRRQREWRAVRKRVMPTLSRAAARGRPQIFGVDANRMNYGMNLTPILEGRRCQAVSHGLDWLYFIDGDHYRWNLVGDKQIVDTNSDHMVLIQRAQLLKRKEG